MNMVFGKLSVNVDPHTNQPTNLLLGGVSLSGFGKSDHYCRGPHPHVNTLVAADSWLFTLKHSLEAFTDTQATAVASRLTCRPVEDPQNDWFLSLKIAQKRFPLERAHPQVFAIQKGTSSISGSRAIKKPRARGSRLVNFSAGFSARCTKVSVITEGRCQ